ncbi:MAG: hypothetical protein QOH05_3096 [Acetobacteraceae bacterium]|jgi:hypothetical protein|nr:hypothetical protein [Acetobacteraceae bacterium]
MRMCGRNLCDKFGFGQKGAPQEVCRAMPDQADLVNELGFALVDGGHNARLFGREMAAGSLPASAERFRAEGFQPG